MDLICCCFPRHEPVYKMKTRIFGKTAFNQPVQLYELENKHGLTLSVMSYGARIVGLKVPNLNGELVDVVRGFDTLEEYAKDEFYFGAIVGRVASRIHPSTVTISGKEWHLIPNTQNVHSNGGKNGFDTAIWTADTIEDDNKNGVSAIRFRYVSPQGSEGYPGELVTEVEYRLTNDNEVIIKIKCQTEEDTVVSIPVHAYFNLGGETEPNIYDHTLTVLAPSYTPTNKDWIPSGEILPVEGTPYDFRNGRKLGEAIKQSPFDGFDDYFCFPDELTRRTTPTLSAKLYNEKNGIHMDLLTTQPGLTVYTANFLNKNIIGKAGVVNDRHSSVCIQTHGYPNAINVPSFPTGILQKGDTLEHTTIFRFTKLKVKAV